MQEMSGKFTIHLAYFHHSPTMQEPKEFLYSTLTLFSHWRLYAASECHHQRERGSFGGKYVVSHFKQ